VHRQRATFNRIIEVFFPILGFEVQWTGEPG